MSYRKFEVYEYKQIIYRLQKNESQRSISKSGFGSRKKIKQIFIIAKKQGWLDLGAMLPSDETLAEIYEVDKKNVVGSALDKYEDLIKMWLEQGLSAVVIHRHLCESYNINIGYNCVQRYVKQLKDSSTRSLTTVMSFYPGQAAQIDFGQAPRLLDRRTGKVVKTWFFVMTLCYSRC